MVVDRRNPLPGLRPVSRCNYNPFATAVAVTAGVAVTSAVIGSVTRTLPPACVPVQYGTMLYRQCGTVWYPPSYVGTTVQYVVMAAPR